jgi:hypothetical protein
MPLAPARIVIARASLVERGEQLQQLPAQDAHIVKVRPVREHAGEPPLDRDTVFYLSTTRQIDLGRGRY